MLYVLCFVSLNYLTLSVPRKETEVQRRMGVAGFHWKHSQMMPDCVWHHLVPALRVMMKMCTYQESPWFALLLAPHKQPLRFLTVFLKKIHLFLIIIMASEHFGDLPFPVTSSSFLRSYFRWLSIFFPIVFCCSRICLCISSLHSWVPLGPHCLLLKCGFDSRSLFSISSTLLSTVLSPIS